MHSIGVTEFLKVQHFPSVLNSAYTHAASLPIPLVRTSSITMPCSLRFALPGLLELRDTAIDLASASSSHTLQPRRKRALDPLPTVTSRVQSPRHASRSHSRQSRRHAKGKSKVVDPKSSMASPRPCTLGYREPNRRHAAAPPPTAVPPTPAVPPPPAVPCPPAVTPPAAVTPSIADSLSSSAQPLTQPAEEVASFKEVSSGSQPTGGPLRYFHQRSIQEGSAEDTQK